MKKNTIRKIRGRMVCVVIILSLWTCMIIGTKTGSNNIIESLNRHFNNILLNIGMGSADVLSANIQKGDGKMKLIFGACPLINYIAENNEDLEEMTDEGTDKIAMAYPGFSSRNKCWSGAGKDMAGGYDLFEKSDIKMAEIEGDNDSAAVIAENKAARLKDDKRVDEKKQTKEIIEKKDTKTTLKNTLPGVRVNLKMINKLKKGKSRSYLLQKFYITDSSTSIDNAIFNVDKLLNMDMTIKKSSKPQILIFHTHGASEAFADSRGSRSSDSIIGVGSYLSKILTEKYGYNVIHDKEPYDMIGGKIDRNRAYNKAGAAINRTLKKYPSIKVVIDLHRDGVGNSVHRTTVINGKSTAQVMFFNGLSRNSSGDIGYLYNPNLQGNLAFSLQMKIKCMEKYPDFAKPVYLKSYRYNMNLKKRYLLIELGNENNKVAEAKNAMRPLAEVLDCVLKGK